MTHTEEPLAKYSQNADDLREHVATTCCTQTSQLLPSTHRRVIPRRPVVHYPETWQLAARSFSSERVLRANWQVPVLEPLEFPLRIFRRKRFKPDCLMPTSSRMRRSDSHVKKRRFSALLPPLSSHALLKVYALAYSMCQHDHAVRDHIADAGMQPSTTVLAHLLSSPC